MSETEKHSDSPVVSLGDNGSLVTVDFGTGPETGGAKAGRIVGGFMLFVVCGLLAIACVVVYFGGAFFADWWLDWADLLGDALLFVGAILLGLSVLGFELMRRGRRRRGETLAAAIDNTAMLLGQDDGTPTVFGPSVDADYNPNRIPAKSQTPPPTTPTVL